MVIYLSHYKTLYKYVCASVLIVKFFFGYPQFCAHVLLKPKDKLSLCEQSKRLSSYLQKKALYKRVNELCKKMSLCPYCSARNGTVKKLPPLKIVHERFKTVKKGDPLLTDYFSK